ncbi:MAG: DUF3459 domain-containing protein, partial [Actinomycetota bacterium]|nr:DUF3459 domain-containing protein [Actinomycetota bacterium]
LRFVDAAPGVLAYTRGGDHVVALNLADEPRPAPAGAGELRLSTWGARDEPAPRELPPAGGFVSDVTG